MTRKMARNPNLNPNPSMPCNVTMAGKIYALGSPFHKFIDDVFEIEGQLAETREALRLVMKECNRIARAANKHVR